MRHSRSDLDMTLHRRYSQGGQKHRSASSGGLCLQIPDDASFAAYSNAFARYDDRDERSWSYSSHLLDRRGQSPSPHSRSISTFTMKLAFTLPSNRTSLDPNFSALSVSISPNFLSCCSNRCFNTHVFFPLMNTKKLKHKYYGNYFLFL